MYLISILQHQIYPRPYLEYVLHRHTIQGRNMLTIKYTKIPHKMKENKECTTPEDNKQVVHKYAYIFLFHISGAKAL